MGNLHRKTVERDQLVKVLTKSQSERTMTEDALLRQLQVNTMEKTLNDGVNVVDKSHRCAMLKVSVRVRAILDIKQLK